MCKFSKGEKRSVNLYRVIYNHLHRLKTCELSSINVPHFPDIKYFENSPERSCIVAHFETELQDASKFRTFQALITIFVRIDRKQYYRLND